MELNFYHIFERKHIAASFDWPLRLTRLGPDDFVDLKNQLIAYIVKESGGGPDLPMVIILCAERLVRSFSWKN